MEYRRIIPNSISGTNLILGVLSIFESVAGNFEWAAIYIILAVAVDACDGRAARALGVAGKMNCAAVQQKFFRQRRFTGVRMRYNGKSAAFFNLFK